MSDRRNKTLRINLEEVFYDLAVDLALKHDMSVSSYGRHLVIRAALADGMLTAEMLQKVVSGD